MDNSPDTGPLTPSQADASPPPGIKLYRCMYCNGQILVRVDEMPTEPDQCPWGCSHEDGDHRV